MYLDYLRTGDASEMSRVLYHNAVDILSLVGLTSLILDRHRLRDPADLSAAEALGLARWHQTAGRTGEAESAWQAALSADERSIKLEALRRLAGYLKQRGRRSEAVSGWRTWHELAPADPEPCIELAKYYEWETGDLEQAVAWSEAALACLDRWPSDWRRDQQAAEIDHRLQRLSRKLNLRE
jgi:tetratricopeptide (TPR) repeat protein